MKLVVGGDDDGRSQNLNGHKRTSSDERRERERERERERWESKRYCSREERDTLS